jgi:hypothetical protein
VDGGEASAESQRLKTKMPSEEKVRKWMWVALLVFFALQIYFVQEMLAALLLFTGVFVIFAIIALLLNLVDRAGQWGLGWAGNQARKGLTLAEEVSKKQLRRPRSETAQ